MFLTSDKINGLFAELHELMFESEAISEEDARDFIEGFTWKAYDPPTPADDAYWLEDNDHQGSLGLMGDAFEAGLRLGRVAAGRPIIFVELGFGGIHGEESQLFFFGDEDEWLARLRTEFDKRFLVAATMAG